MTKPHTKPSVSIVIPLTKPTTHIIDTLESARKQTYKDIEILIGNATGVRAIGGILRKYAKRRRYVHIYRIAKGKDKRTTFNIVAAKARGRFVTRIDPGDIATKSRIAKQVEYLSAHPLVVAVGGQKRPYKKYARVNPHKELPLDHERIYALSFLSLAINPSTIMVNNNKLPKSFRWYNQSLEHIQDFDLVFHLMEYGELANLPDTVALTYNIDALHQVYGRGERFVQSVRALFHAITRYGRTPTVKTLTRSSLRFLL